MRWPQHDHQSRDQPSGDDANLLDEAFLDPEEELIGLLQHSTRRHRAPPPPMPAKITFLLFDRLLEHDLQPTISAGPRAAAGFRFRRIAQRSPATRGGCSLPLAGSLTVPRFVSPPVTPHRLRDVL